MNIAEILKDCPKGTKLYSPLCGECELNRIHNELKKIIVSTSDGTTLSFYNDGKYFQGNNGECLLFPSKENRDWSKFQRPFEPKFKVGDKIVKKNNTTVSFIITGVGDEFYYSTTLSSVNLLPIENQDDWELVSDKVELKFKVGDKIKHKVNKTSPFTITEITDTSYKGGYRYEVLIEQQDNFELVPDKFDITTLKPFNKVLVRDNDRQEWSISLFSHYNGLKNYKYSCINGNGYAQCIPYEAHKELRGTTDDCDNFYKTW